MAHRFIDAVKARSLKQSAKRLHSLGKKNWIAPQIAKNATIAKESKLKFRLCNAFFVDDAHGPMRFSIFTVWQF
jgi:hypothetical protein